MLTVGVGVASYFIVGWKNGFCEGSEITLLSQTLTEDLDQFKGSRSSVYGFLFWFFLTGVFLGFSGVKRAEYAS